MEKLVIIYMLYYLEWFRFNRESCQTTKHDRQYQIIIKGYYIYGTINKYLKFITVSVDTIRLFCEKNVF